MCEEGVEKIAIKRVKKKDKLLMGQIDGNTYNGPENRIWLFDGKFTTGYRIAEFKVIDRNPTTGVELIAKLSTNPKSYFTQWNFNDIEEVAWASFGAPQNAVPEVDFIRDDAMIIEDLWIGNYNGSDNRKVNYRIKLEAYEFPAGDGAGAMVINESQS